MFPCGKCGKWIMDGDICWRCVNEAAEEQRLQREVDIDRAMQWCEEYLREREVELYHFNNDDCKELFDSSFDLYFDTCVRYLEKVEAGL